MQEYCRAIVCEGLAQGPYVAAREGFEPAMHGNEPTTELPRPTPICPKRYCSVLFVTSDFSKYGLGPGAPPIHAFDTDALFFGLSGFLGRFIRQMFCYSSRCPALSIILL